MLKKMLKALLSLYALFEMPYLHMFSRVPVILRGKTHSIFFSFFFFFVFK